MADLSNKEKKELAQILFNTGDLNQKEIAARVKTSENTLTKWVKDGGWEELRTHLTITRKSELTRYYQQIKELNDVILSRPPGERFADASEVYILNQLSAAARHLETKTPLGEIVRTCQDLVMHIKQYDLKAAQTIVEWVDSFVKSKIRNEDKG